MTKERLDEIEMLIVNTAGGGEHLTLTPLFGGIKQLVALAREGLELEAIVNEQSKTITTLCLAIDPESNHGPETAKIAAYAEHSRKTASEATMGVILKCGSCNGLGQVYCYQVQDHIEYKECSTCGGTGINDNATKKIFDLQSELAELRRDKERLD
jgi:hypothetical protein